MPNPVLKLRDGFADQSPHLRDDIKRLQEMLKKAGYMLAVDGLFGEDTLKAVRAFQRDKGLEIDGVVGPETWLAFGVNDAAGETPSYMALLNGFQGDLQWVHDREGHAGKTYWPGGNSGVTLDPGVDLGHAKPTLIEAAYKNLLTAQQFSAVQKALGIKGNAAKSVLNADSVLRSIRINRSQADTIFPFAAKRYWDGIVRRIPSLADVDTLPSVQTVMLSLSYNRGWGNDGLEPLKLPIENKDWAEVADLIGSMQQNHRLAGIRMRRRMEAELIRNELT